MTVTDIPTRVKVQSPNSEPCLPLEGPGEASDDGVWALQPSEKETLPETPEHTTATELGTQHVDEASFRAKKKNSRDHDKSSFNAIF